MNRYLRGAATSLPPVRRLVEQRDRLARDLERERATSRRLAAEVESLVSAPAPSGAGVEPGRYGYLFMVTYGRSGSTLLQGVLNSIDGYTIRGENGGALYQLFRYHQALEAKSGELASAPSVPDSPTHPWFGLHRYPVPLALDRQRALVVDTVLRPEAGSRVLGFKEVRWYWKDTPEYVAYLGRAFPGARFLFNTRSHDKVAASKWWRDRPDARAELERIESMHLGILEGLGDAGLRVHYDDYVADPAALQPMYDWLGEPLDVERVRAVMAEPHSY